MNTNNNMIVDVNVIMKFDSIQIVASCKNKDKGNFFIHNERISHNNKTTKEISKRIREAINDIEAKTSKKVECVNIIFDDFMKKVELMKFTNRITKEEVNFGYSGKFFEKDDCEKIINDAINKEIADLQDDKIVVSVIPFRFYYVETANPHVTKELQAFPVGKIINKLEIHFSIRYIDRQNYLKINSYFEGIGIKIKNIALESQLSIYGNSKVDSINKKSYLLVIKEHRTVLITISNDIAIMSDELDYSINNLIEKFKKNFGISYKETMSLINTYADLKPNNDEKFLQEVVYSYYSLNSIPKPITRNEIIEIVKSFLKSICTQANNIIQERIGSKTTNLKIDGNLSKVNEINSYCTKYFNENNIVLMQDESNEWIYSWNENYVSNMNYYMFMKTLDNKVRPENVYYDNNDNSNRSNTFKEEKKSIDVATSQNKPVLA